jgi:ribosome biogenesis GTPase
MIPLPPSANARVIAVAGKRCRLELADGRRPEGIARGRLFEDGRSNVVVGDGVIAEEHREYWTVETVLPRRNEFVREGLRRECQVLFANVDRVLILASLSQPQTKSASIDRFLLAALKGGIAPSLVLTKTDLDSAAARQSEIGDLYAPFDLPVYPVCNLTGQGFEQLTSAIVTGITALVGHSGVGKTTLLNRLIPGLDLRTSQVSAWSGKGVHTTTAALMVPYGPQSAIVDTPGMKSFIPYGVTRDNIIELFPDIVEQATRCRFRNCRHLTEPDCAVRAAADNGRLSRDRLQSYHRLIEGLT